IQHHAQLAINVAEVARHAGQQLVEVGAIHLAEVVVGTKLRLDVEDRQVGHVPGIQRLQSQTAGLATGRCLGATGGARTLLTVHQASSCLVTLTVSKAAMAASAPLLPALVPERSMACSMLSTVSTPKATGIPYSSDTAPTPLTHSPATYSKCGVPPRMTAPRVMMASYCLRSATLRTISGISKAPGTRTMVMSASLTPWRLRVSTAPSTRLSTTKLLKRPTTRA